LILRISCTAEILAKWQQSFIAGSTPILGVLFLLGLLVVWMPSSRISRGLLWGISGIFFLQAILKFIDSGYEIAQLIELSLQVLCPAFLALASSRIDQQKLYAYFRLAIALTFMGHGWYALGIIYEQPGHFIEMVVKSLGFLGMNAEVAYYFLMVAGILDMLVVIGVFVPEYIRISALYACIWGFLTSAARLAAYVRLGESFWSQLAIYLPEFLIRVPHFSVPWIVFRDVQNEEAREVVPIS
ncbi:MAG: hypothetical protein AAF696_16015, partial [Bacteroidota bacterium]